MYYHVIVWLYNRAGKKTLPQLQKRVAGFFKRKPNAPTKAHIKPPRPHLICSTIVTQSRMVWSTFEQTSSKRHFHIVLIPANTLLQSNVGPAPPTWNQHVLYLWCPGGAAPSEGDNRPYLSLLCLLSLLTIDPLHKMGMAGSWALVCCLAKCSTFFCSACSTTLFARASPALFAWNSARTVEL